MAHRLRFLGGCCCLFLAQCMIAQAQNHFHFNHQGAMRPQSQDRHGHASFGFATFGGGMTGRHHGHGLGGGIVMFQPVYLMPPQVVGYTYPVSTVPAAAPVTLISPPAVPNTSTAAARLKSIEWQTRGDQRMRLQKWADARVAYANAISAAPDRAASHFRLGVCYVVMQRYDQAIREIKRALTIDPTIPKSGLKLETIFGPEGALVCHSIVGKMADWLREEPNNPDRLFLYGVVLHLASDPKAKDVLDAALHSKPGGDVGHIALFLEGARVQEHGGVPELNHRPDPIMFTQTGGDLRFPKATTPLPDAPVPMP